MSVEGTNFVPSLAWYFFLKQTFDFLLSMQIQSPPERDVVLGSGHCSQWGIAKTLG